MHQHDQSTGKPGRIASLDTVRGLFLCISVASASLLAPKPAFAVHATWFGVEAVDLIFPLFVTLSGCGLAFAYRNRVGWVATLRRSLVLLLAGLAYNAVTAGSVDFATLRFPARSRCTPSWCWSSARCTSSCAPHRRG